MTTSKAEFVNREASLAFLEILDFLVEGRELSNFDSALICHRNFDLFYNPFRDLIRKFHSLLYKAETQESTIDSWPSLQ